MLQYGKYEQLLIATDCNCFENILIEIIKVKKVGINIDGLRHASTS